MTVRLLITILQLVLEDGPSIYGDVLSALDDIHALINWKGRDITLDQLDRILEKNSIDIDAIVITYTPKRFR